MHGENRRIKAVILAGALTVCLSGCSRSMLNYQIAECIGTLGEYDNNEPVETPKMQAERERQESEEALALAQEEALATAASMALTYDYQGAIEYLSGSEALKGDDRALEAIEEYQSAINSMYVYDGAIGHFCFTNLVMDTDRAFDGDEYSAIYQQNMITMEEFTNILDSLYESGYILIDIHDLAQETESTGGSVTLTEKELTLPNGKKPLVFSVENLDYSSIRNGDGVATCLALDDEGEVAAVYTDEEGHDLLGAYDVVPALEAFIGEHPDFSYLGARGIIGVAGTNGVFGYKIEEDAASDYAENQETVRAIAAKLLEDGWTFASEGYSYQYMGDMTYDTLKEDISRWKSTAGQLLGDCDILLYPYGSEVDYTSEKASYLINQGLRYLVGMWSDGDHLEVNSTYLRQTRRTVTGYVLENYPGNFSDYFPVASIIDPAR